MGGPRPRPTWPRPKEGPATSGPQLTTQLSWLVGARCGNNVIGTVQLLIIWNDQYNDGNCVTNFKLCDGE